MSGMWLTIGLVVGACWGAWIATVGDRLDRRDRERALRNNRR